VKKRLFLAVACASCLLLAACGGTGADGGASGEEAEGPSETVAAPSTDEFDRDAEFTWAAQVLPSSFDPHRQTFSGGSVPALVPVHDRLVYIDPYTGELQPMLATEWEASEDGTSITFTLRDDVTYHDGTPFDAESVVANVDHATSIGEGHPSYSKYALIESATAEDDHTVRFDLTGVYAGVIPELMGGGLGMYISPATFDREDDAEAVAGTGPYVMADARPGQSYDYLPYEDYWDPEAQTVAELTVIAEDSEDTILNGIASGEYDAGRVSPAVKARAETTDGVQVVSQLGNTAQVMGMNIELIEGAGDPDVVRAINMAVNRDELANGALRGECVPSVQPWNENSPGHNPDYPADFYGNDPEAAQQLLADAGYPDGIAFTIHTYTNPAYVPIAETLQAQLAEAGITVDIEQHDSAVLSSGYRTDETLETWLTRTPYGAPPIETITTTWLPDAVSNPGNWTNEDLVALTDEVMAETDTDAQAELLQDVVAQLVESPSHSLILCHEYSLWLGGEDVVGLNEPVAGYTDFRRMGIAADAG
jgi:ABC-type transport system substrate-binding protein